MKNFTMTTKTTVFLVIIFITALNASDPDEATMEKYEEAENLLYARTARQFNVTNYYVFGVQKLCKMYQACKHAAVDSTLRAKITLALAKALYEQMALIDEKGKENMEFAIFLYSSEKYSFDYFPGSEHLDGTLEGALKAIMKAY
jgi:hypothetical protein